MSWLNKQVSLYETHSDNTGRPSTFRSVLLSDFGSDMQTICDLRRLDRMAPDYKEKKGSLKSTLQGYTPGALLPTRSTKAEAEIQRTGVMQIDFDHEGIKDYDIDELKLAVFDLPFIGFCGLSCSGDGFYCLAIISEPERQKEYAEHCFDVLKGYGINPDTSKGRNVNDLRYLSYDKNMLIREAAEPLLIKKFRTKPVQKIHEPGTLVARNNTGLTKKKLGEIESAQVGQRWATVQNVAYTLGGLGDILLLNDLKKVIGATAAFHGQEDKYFKCAEDCFKEGFRKPLTVN